VRTHTLSGTLHYAGARVVMLTMTYKYKDRLAPNPTDRGKPLLKTAVDLTIILYVTGGTRVAELGTFNLIDIQMRLHYF
jgi:acetoacetate decarboxylase